MSSSSSHIPLLCAKADGGRCAASAPRSTQTDCTCDSVSGRLTLSSALRRQQQQQLQEDKQNCCSRQDYIRREERLCVRQLHARTNEHVAATHCEFSGCRDPQLKRNRHPTFPQKHVSRWSVNATGGGQSFTSTHGDTETFGSMTSQTVGADYSPIGQLSYTCLAMSAAESLGEKRNSFVFPLTKMSFRLIWKTNQVLLLEKHSTQEDTKTYFLVWGLFMTHLWFSKTTFFINVTFLPLPAIAVK